LSDSEKYNFLFVFWLILGKETAFRNLQKAIRMMKDIESTWVPIEMNPHELIARIPPFSMNHSLKYGLVARSRVRALERSGGRFHAAFFNHILPALFLNNFRKRVPSIDALDVTPMSLSRDGQLYYHAQRRRGLQKITDLKTRYARFVYGNAKVLLPQSQYTRTSLLQDYHLPERNIRVVVPVVDLEMWSGTSDFESKAKQSGKEISVLFVGGDFYRKGGDLLVNVARRPEFRNCRFHFVTKQFKGEVTDNLRIHSDAQPNSTELMGLYKESDVFVLPTRADFAPTNSLCEAMAMGLPVISTGVGGIGEFLSDGNTGYVVPCDDENAIAERLSVLKENVDLRGRMSRNAREFAEIRFDLVKNARMIVELMKESVHQTAG
jgi:glycosyltransferase involved in cell wall biosynthesis